MSEAAVFDEDYAVEAFTDWYNNGINYGATPEIRATTHLRWLAVVALQVRAIAHQISILTDIEFSAAEYSTLLRLFRFLGIYGNKWVYLAELTQVHRTQMNDLLDKICDGIAFRFRDDCPQGLESDLFYLYNEVWGHPIAKNLPIPWERFTRCGAYTACLKQFFLSLNSEQLWMFFNYSYMKCLLDGFTPTWIIGLRKSTLDVANMILPAADPGAGQTIRATMPDRPLVPEPTVDDWADDNDLAAWNTALYMAEAEVVRAGGPFADIYDPETARLSDAFRNDVQNRLLPQLAIRWSFNWSEPVERYAHWPAPVARYVLSRWLRAPLRFFQNSWVLLVCLVATWLVFRYITTGVHAQLIPELDRLRVEDAPEADWDHSIVPGPPFSDDSFLPGYSLRTGSYETVLSSMVPDGRQRTVITKSVTPAMSDFASGTTSLVDDGTWTSAATHIGTATLSQASSAASPSSPAVIGESLDSSSSVTGASSPASGLSSRTSSTTSSRSSPSSSPLWSSLTPSSPSSSPPSSSPTSPTVSRLPSERAPRPDDVYLLVDRMTCRAPVRIYPDGTIDIRDGKCTIDSSDLRPLSDARVPPPNRPAAKQGFWERRFGKHKLVEKITCSAPVKIREDGGVDFVENARCEFDDSRVESSSVDGVKSQDTLSEPDTSASTSSESIFEHIHTETTSEKQENRKSQLLASRSYTAVFTSKEISSQEILTKTTTTDEEAEPTQGLEDVDNTGDKISQTLILETRTPLSTRNKSFLQTIFTKITAIGKTFTPTENREHVDNIEDKVLQALTLEIRTPVSVSKERYLQATPLETLPTEDGAGLIKMTEDEWSLAVTSMIETLVPTRREPLSQATRTGTSPADSQAVPNRKPVGMEEREDDVIAHPTNPLGVPVPLPPPAIRRVIALVLAAGTPLVGWLLDFPDMLNYDAFINGHLKPLCRNVFKTIRAAWNSPLTAYALVVICTAVVLYYLIRIYAREIRTAILWSRQQVIRVSSPIVVDLQAWVVWLMQHPITSLMAIFVAVYAVAYQLQWAAIKRYEEVATAETARLEQVYDYVLDYPIAHAHDYIRAFGTTIAVGVLAIALYHHEYVLRLSSASIAFVAPTERASNWWKAGLLLSGFFVASYSAWYQLQWVAIKRYEGDATTETARLEPVYDIVLDYPVAIIRDHVRAFATAIAATLLAVAIYHYEYMLRRMNGSIASVAPTQRARNRWNAGLSLSVIFVASYTAWYQILWSAIKRHEGDATTGAALFEPVHNFVLNCPLAFLLEYSLASVREYLLAFGTAIAAAVIVAASYYRQQVGRKLRELVVLATPTQETANWWVAGFSLSGILVATHAAWYQVQWAYIKRREGGDTAGAAFFEPAFNFIFDRYDAFLAVAGPFNYEALLAVTGLATLAGVIGFSYYYRDSIQRWWSDPVFLPQHQPARNRWIYYLSIAGISIPGILTAVYSYGYQFVWSCIMRYGGIGAASSFTRDHPLGLVVATILGGVASTAYVYRDYLYLELVAMRRGEQALTPWPGSVFLFTMEVATIFLAHQIAWITVRRYEGSNNVDPALLERICTATATFIWDRKPIVYVLWFVGSVFSFRKKGSAATTYALFGLAWLHYQDRVTVVCPMLFAIDSDAWIANFVDQRVNPQWMTVVSLIVLVVIDYLQEPGWLAAFLTESIRFFEELIQLILRAVHCATSDGQADFALLRKGLFVLWGLFNVASIPWVGTAFLTYAAFLGLWSWTQGAVYPWLILSWFVGSNREVIGRWTIWVWSWIYPWAAPIWDSIGHWMIWTWDQTTWVLIWIWKLTTRIQFDFEPEDRNLDLDVDADGLVLL